MVITTDDFDIIIIDMEELFGKTVHFSVLDATKVPEPRHPDRILVMSPEDKEIFLSLSDKVIADISPHLIPRLSVMFSEELDVLLADEVESSEGEGESQHKHMLVAVFDKGHISREGLEILDISLDRALSEGVLSQWQEGHPELVRLQPIHERNYRNTINQVANVVTYRVARRDRVKILSRNM